MNKKRVITIGIVAAVAIIVLHYLLKKSAENQGTPASPTTIAPAAVTSQQYPAAAPIKLGDLSINVGAPPYLTYNQPPQTNYSAEVGDGPNSCACGGDAGKMVNFPKVAPDLFQSAVENFQSYLQRTGGVAPSAVAQAISKKAAPIPARPAPRPVAPHQIFGVA